MEVFLFVVALAAPTCVWVWAQLRFASLEQAADLRHRNVCRELLVTRHAVRELQLARLNNKRLPPGQRPLSLVPPADGGDL